MAKAIVGKVQVAAVWVNCPKCGGKCVYECGSMLISLNIGDPQMNCVECGVEVALPKKYRMA